MSDDEVIAITGRENIEAARLIALRIALGTEIRTGMVRSNRGRSTLAIVNEAMNTSYRNKATAYKKFDAWLVAQYPGRVDPRPLVKKEGK